MKLFIITLFLSATSFYGINLNAKESVLYGYIFDEQGNPLEMVTVNVSGISKGVITNNEGYYEISLESNKTYTIIYSYLGYESTDAKVTLKEGERKNKNITLEFSTTFLPDIEIKDFHSLSPHLTRIDPKHADALPGPSAGIEALLTTLPGVSSASELTSQYSVRGGNFDENLIYVNGIEIYRPFLIRSGQQEGLSFLNSDLVSSISFSAGGFDAQYGDKMSSVLDIKYKTPQEFAGSASMSLLDGSVHLEGRAFNNKKLGYLIGVRHKNNQYLLGTLDTEGDYRPSFTDVQTLLTYNIENNFSITFLGNYSKNSYFFEPEVQKTRFGHLEDARQLTIYFDGQESDHFITALGALSLNYTPSKNLNLQFTSSVFQSDENETFDILGQYRMHRIGADFGQDDFGEPTGKPLAVGSFFNHARNYLNAIVYNADHKGIWNLNNNMIKWGVKYQHEDIYDRLKEWTLIDSAGYSTPRLPKEHIILDDFTQSRISLKSNRISGYIQNNMELENHHGEYILIGGIRGNYWDFNDQLLISPRATFIFKPNEIPNLVLRASAGMYHQAPFYRELRDIDGNINKNIKAQESLHFVLGSEYDFIAWNRPFKFSSEIYYKNFNNLIPYELDNVRIRYYAENNAKGYATGLDMKLHGEFVPGIDSWASLSLMKTEEKISYKDEHGNTTWSDYIPRPTDQRLNFSLYFQDFLPKNSSYKVHLGLFYGSRLPFGPPTYERRADTLRMPAYRRVDIGFSKQLIDKNTSLTKNNPLRHIESMWITAEVFNLLEISNTISYLWIKDVENRMFAVPNYLTSRLINIKLAVNF